MIKKGSENGKNSFKKFSDMNGNDKIKKQEQEEELNELPQGNPPASPNLPLKGTKVQKTQNTRNLKPLADKQDYDKEGNSIKDTNEKVQIYGKVARMPKGVKASKGYNFLENVKISKNSIWYIMVEKCDNELQMVKYNHKEGFDLSKFITDLKSFYLSKYSGNDKIKKMIEKISIEGNDKYSSISNIPLVEVDGKKMISKITEDLIRLLSK